MSKPEIPVTHKLAPGRADGQRLRVSPEGLAVDFADTPELRARMARRELPLPAHAMAGAAAVRVATSVMAQTASIARTSFLKGRRNIPMKSPSPMIRRCARPGDRRRIDAA